MSPEDALKNLLVRVKVLIKNDSFEMPLPSATADFFTPALTPVNSDIPVIFRVYTAISKSGILSATITRGGSTVTLPLNNDISLNPDVLYSFDISLAYGDEFNLKYSVANGTIHTLRIVEIPEGI